jgi:hypothetical protein
MEWGYPLLGGSRYAFDEHLKGWEQFDTAQDAPYYGIWTSVDRLSVVHYSEGDVSLVVAPDREAFKAEVRALWDWNRGRRPDDDLHTQLDSPKLHEACLVGHPPFDDMLAGYRRRVELATEYTALHVRAQALLVDPSLPPSGICVREAGDHVFFLRGWPGDRGEICVCRKEERNFNRPDRVLSPGAPQGLEALTSGVKLLEALAGS